MRNVLYGYLSLKVSKAKNGKSRRNYYRQSSSLVLLSSHPLFTFKDILPHASLTYNPCHQQILLGCIHTCNLVRLVHLVTPGKILQNKSSKSNQHTNKHNERFFGSKQGWEPSIATTPAKYPASQHPVLERQMGPNQDQNEILGC